MANESNNGRRMQLSRDGANKLQQELEDRRKLHKSGRLRGKAPLEGSWQPIG